jgi:hypothetical protein
MTQRTLDTTALVVFVATACFVLTRCKQTPPTPPEPTVVVVGGDGGACAAACWWLRAGDCPEGQPSPRTRTPCEAVCGRSPALFGAACIAATDGGIEELHLCGVRCIP